MDTQESSEGRPGQMPATLWTLILSARELESKDRAAALARLCEVYWYPLYVFVRRQGYDHHAAEDLTQGFFEHLFTRDWLQGVDQEKGRFRTYLLAALTHYLQNEREKRSAIKRGGQISGFVSWDAALAESRHRAEPVADADPAQDYDRLWARALVERALELLRREYAHCKKEELFRVLSPWMARPVPPDGITKWASQLGMSEGALRVARHRLAQRFGQVVREEVAHTVRDVADVESELRAVLAAWVREGSAGEAG